MEQLRIGTRGSALARAQAEHVARLVREADPAFEVQIQVIAVSGDRGPDEDAPRPADKSRWVDAIEDALLAGEVDLAVHSAKDVPGHLAEQLALVGAPPREDPRDVLCGAAGIDSLPPGARVGTSRLRRAAQLRAQREDLDVVPLRGNVDTRLRRWREGGYDAIVLAAAGLRRLGLLDDSAAPVDPAVLVPAPGQGTLALQARADDTRATRLAASISDPQALSALEAERALVRTLEAGCRTPLGAHATPLSGGRLALEVFVGLPDGSAWARDRLAGSEDRAAALGESAGARLLAAGAAGLLRQAEEMAVAGG